MAKCPDCGGEVKYKAPFMVCLDCGLSFKRGEYDKVKSTIRSEFKDEMGESDEETDRKERRRKFSFPSLLMKTED